MKTIANKIAKCYGHVQLYVEERKFFHSVL